MKKKVKSEIKHPDTNEYRNRIFQNLWDATKGVHIDTALLQEIRKISNEQSNFTSKGTRKRNHEAQK